MKKCITTKKLVIGDRQTQEVGQINGVTSMKRTEPWKSLVIFSPLKTRFVFHHQWCLVWESESVFNKMWKGVFHYISGVWLFSVAWFAFNFPQLCSLTDLPLFLSLLTWANPASKPILRETRIKQKLKQSERESDLLIFAPICPHCPFSLYWPEQKYPPNQCCGGFIFYLENGSFLSLLTFIAHHLLHS